MAFTEFYCDYTNGSNMNGGSDANSSPSYAATNGGWNSGTGVFTPTSGNPSSSGVTVGQFASVFLDGATTPVFVGRVTAVSSTTVTVSTTANSGTAPTTAGSGISINVGGVWKGPNGTVNFPFNFVTSTLKDAGGDAPRVNFKNNATYSVTAAIAHNNSGSAIFQGYSSSAGDGGKAIIDGGTSGASYGLLTFNAGDNTLADMILQNNGSTGSAIGLSIAQVNICIFRVVVNNVAGIGISSSSGSVGYVLIQECEVYAANKNNTIAKNGFDISSVATLVRCVAHDNTGANTNGFNISSPTATLINCIADTNGRCGIQLGAAYIKCQGCVAYNNTSDGIKQTTGSGNIIENCILSLNGGYGISFLGTIPLAFLNNNAFYTNTSGQTNGANASLVTGSITLSGDPFNASSTGDFRLNNTAGAGAACRQAGRGAFTETQASYTGTVAYPDIGAVETQVVYPTAAQVQLGVTFDVLAAVTGTYNPGGGGGAILSRAFLGMGAGV